MTGVPLPLSSISPLVLIIMWLFDIIKLLFSQREINIPDIPGLIESPTDYRDVDLGAIQKDLAPLPDSYQIPYKLKVTNQRGNSSCVGHVCAYLKAEKERREQNFIDFDPEWLYKKCKEIDGIPEVRGTYFRTGLKVLKNIGAKPLNGTEAEAGKYKIGGFARIKDITFKSLKQAIYEYGIVFDGFRGSNQGWKDSHIRPLRPGERKWGHAVASTGFTKNRIVFLNSWGENQGDNGYYNFDKGYLPFECWCVLNDLPNNWEELLKPQMDKPKHFFRENLHRGMRGREVVILQDCMKWLGCLDKSIDSTGFFGDLTLESVKCFQLRYNIRPVFGFVGPKTRSQLNKLFN